MSGSTQLEEKLEGSRIGEDADILGDAACAVALVVPCATGKSAAIRSRIRRRRAAGIKTLDVVVTANRCYTDNCARDWEKALGESCVMSYLNENRTTKKPRQIAEFCNRPGGGILLISIESLMKIPAGTKIGILTVEETCEIVGKAGGLTVPSIMPYRHLRDLARTAGHILYPDADFFADDRCHRFAAYLDPRRSLKVIRVSEPLEHMWREPMLYFTGPFANSDRNEDAWFEELSSFLRAASASGGAEGKRVAVGCALLKTVKRVAALARGLGLSYKIYTSETDERQKKKDLRNPDCAWVDIHAIAFTQTLSVGADPAEIQFAAVFLQASSYGCCPRLLIQGALRFGRHPEWPLICRKVYILVDPAPVLRSKDGFAHQAIAALGHENRVYQRHDLLLHRDVSILNAMQPDRANVQLHADYVPLTEEEIAWMAPAYAERLRQQHDLLGLLTSDLGRHGWLLGAADSRAYEELLERATRSPPEEDFGQRLAATESPALAYQVVLDSVGDWNLFLERTNNTLVSSATTTLEKMALKILPVMTAVPADMIPRLAGADIVTLLRLRPALQVYATGANVGFFRQSMPVAPEAPHSFERAQHRVLGDLIEASQLFLEPDQSLFDARPRLRSVVEGYLLTTSRSTEALELDARLRVTLTAMHINPAAGLDNSLRAVLRRAHLGLEVVHGKRPRSRKGTVRSDTGRDGRSKVGYEVTRLKTRLSRTDSAGKKVEVAWGPLWQVASPFKDDTFANSFTWGDVHRDLDLDALEDLMAEQWTLEPVESVTAVLSTSSDAAVVWEPVPLERATELLQRLTSLLSSQRCALSLERLTRGRLVLGAMLKACSEADADGIAWLRVSYSRRHTIGRLVANVPSYQRLPNRLRQYLLHGGWRDFDIKACHPSIYVGLAADPATECPTILRYVEDTTAFIEAIQRYYKLPSRDQAKTAIVSALNQGNLWWWRKNAMSPLPESRGDLDDLVSFRLEAKAIRDRHILTRPEGLSILHQLKLERSRESEDKLLRSASCYVVMELESLACEAALAALDAHGFKQASKIFDGGLASAGVASDIPAALEEANAAMEAAVGFAGLQIVEKPLFHCSDPAL